MMLIKTPLLMVFNKAYGWQWPVMFSQDFTNLRGHTPNIQIYSKISLKDKTKWTTLLPKLNTFKSKVCRLHLDNAKNVQEESLIQTKTGVLYAQPTSTLQHHKRKTEKALARNAQQISIHLQTLMALLLAFPGSPAQLTTWPVRTLETPKKIGLDW